MFALDTDAVSHAMRGEGLVKQRLQQLRADQVVLPALVVYEVSYGLRRAGRRQQLDGFVQWVSALRVLDFDASAADHAARIRIELEAAGTPIGKHDLLIAATVRRHGCTLVTHNVREFARVSALTLDDWY